MTRDIININDFIILVETANSPKPVIDSCAFEEPLIAVAFYGSGNVDLTVKFGAKEIPYNHTKGLALSFYADDKVEFAHTVSDLNPLECIVIATTAKNLNKLSVEEGELFSELLNQLVFPKEHYVEGPRFFMSPEMQSVVDQIFHSRFEGKSKMLFFKSQISSLLAHYFGQLSLNSETSIKSIEKEKLLLAKEILTNNLETPPSLSELSKQIGLNTFKLKKNFKELFGVPVFKYLQNERLTQANELLRNQKMTVQEAAWHVGYDSLSSFSNAFSKKFGYRPSDIKQ